MTGLRNYRRIGRVLLAGAGLVLISLGAVYLIDWVTVTQVPAAPLTTEAVTVSTERPSEALPDAECEKYDVPGDMPRRLVIEKIGVAACVQRMGIDQYGAIAVPTNIHLAGWYEASARPGEPGNSIIDGHVYGRYRDAVFSRLPELTGGDSLKVEMGDLQVREFEVIEVVQVTKQQADDELYRQYPEIDAQLTLITCGGAYEEGQGTYTDRVIVRARLVSA